MPPSWKRLLKTWFGEAEEVKVKALRRTVVAAAARAYEEAGEEAPSREALKAKFDEKLRSSSKFELAGKRVRRKGKGGGLADEREEAQAELRQQKHRHPSSVTWNSSLKAQRYGPFSKAEKDALDAAIRAYALEHSLPPTTHEWLFHTRAGPDGEGGKGERLRAVWLELAAAVPHRSPNQVWGHATRRLHALHGAGGSRWSMEDRAALTRLVEVHGNSWVDIGAAMERMPHECRERWRSISRGHKKRSRWSAEEVQQLREMVAEALADGRRRTVTAGEAAVRRDNFDWTAMSVTMGSRSAAAIQAKWYEHLAPSMREAGEWAKGEDKLLLKHLLHCGAEEESEVHWAGAVPGRDGLVSMRRWCDGARLAARNAL